MLNIACYSVFELACAFATSLHGLYWLRALFGIAMGGEWGVGAALAFETLPKEGRGFFSGLLQEGYAVGYLAGGGGIWPAVSALCPDALAWARGGMARHVYSWRGACAAGLLHRLEGGGVAGLAKRGVGEGLAIRSRSKMGPRKRNQTLCSHVLCFSFC